MVQSLHKWKRNFTDLTDRGQFIGLEYYITNKKHSVWSVSGEVSRSNPKAVLRSWWCHQGYLGLSFDTICDKSSHNWWCWSGKMRPLTKQGGSDERLALGTKELLHIIEIYVSSALILTIPFKISINTKSLDSPLMQYAYLGSK